MTLPRKPTGPPARRHDLMVYMLEGVPRRLIDRAKTKAKAQIPPTTVKAVLIRALQQWVGHDPGADAF